MTAKVDSCEKLKREPNIPGVLAGMRSYCPVWDTKQKPHGSLEKCPYPARYCTFKNNEDLMRAVRSTILEGHPIKLSEIEVFT